MAQKSDQHVIPQVYLKSFCDGTPPPDWPDGRPFAPCVWLIPKWFDAPRKRRAPRNIFRVHRAYALRTDPPETSVLEDSLQIVETRYGDLLASLNSRRELPGDEYAWLTLFIGTLYARSIENLDHWQRQWDKMERVQRSVERRATGREDQSDRDFWMGSENSRRRLFLLAKSHAEVIAPSGWLLSNDTDLNFVTSDHPVVHTFPHTDELAALGFGPGVIPKDATSADWAFFSHVALTPTLAFVSSPLLLPASGSMYRPVTDYRQVVAFNEFVRSHARTYIVSQIEKSFGEAEYLLVLLKMVVEQSRGRSTPVSGVFVRTATDRYLIESNDVHWELDKALSSQSFGSLVPIWPQ